MLLRDWFKVPAYEMSEHHHLLGQLYKVEAGNNLKICFGKMTVNKCIKKLLGWSSSVGTDYSLAFNYIMYYKHLM